MVLVLCLIISHSKNFLGVTLQINRYGHLLPKIHWDFFLQEGWGCLFSMTAAWKSHVITVFLGGIIFYSARDVGVGEWGEEALAYESGYWCTLTCIAFPS